MRVMLKILDFILEHWRKALELFKEGTKSGSRFRNSELAAV